MPQDSIQMPTKSKPLGSRPLGPTELAEPSEKGTGRVSGAPAGCPLSTRPVRSNSGPWNVRPRSLPPLGRQGGLSETARELANETMGKHAG